MWGGTANSNGVNRSSQLATTIEVFDHSIETWKQFVAEGSPHPGVYSVACTSSGNQLFAYGGFDGRTRRGVLSKLDVDTLTWSMLSTETPSGPMRKWECDIVYFHGGKLALFGGYGLPTNPIQPGSSFIKDSKLFSDGTGWSNEFHTFDLGRNTQ